MRKKRLAANMVFSLILQIVTVICGFILPRLILTTYGSEINGLVNSISQFLHIISFLELGVGAVVQTALYKPLADNDNKSISAVIASAAKFFRNIGVILLAYTVVLMVIYPYIAHQNFSHLYTATLILAISISSFAQYYFGVVDGLLLNADQRGYIASIAGVITIIVTTLVCCLEMLAGFSIHIVKLSSSLIYLVRPLLMRLYIIHHYSIDRNIKFTGEPIKQKWNGIAQHISTVVLDQTDVIVLTLFSTLANVSIYSVYQMIVFGIKNLFFSVANGGIQSLIGELWARNEEDKVKIVFKSMEWAVHSFASYIYTCTALLIIPFVMVYTKGVSDANYIQPLFSALIVTANATHCIRLPYHIMIKAAGKYKETQSNYVISTLINVIISVICVWFWGLIGVALGTLVSMAYQTVWMAIYNAKNIVKNSITGFFKLLITDVISVSTCIIVARKIIIHNITYSAWIILSLKVSIVCLLIFICVNLLMCRDEIRGMINLMKKGG